MSQSCTIYTEKDFSQILSYFENLEFREIPNADLIVFERNYFEGNIKASIKKRVSAGDSFSQMILGTWNFIRDIETKFEARKTELINRILNCQSAIGIVASPEFTETDKRLDFVFDLTEMFDGIIFNGAEMIDKNGRIILDQSGNSELN